MPATLRRMNRNVEAALSVNQADLSRFGSLDDTDCEAMVYFQL